MRNILVDRARRRHAKKRGGGIEKLPFDEEMHVPAREEETDLVALDEALDKLDVMDASLGRLLELRAVSACLDEIIDRGLYSPLAKKVTCEYPASPWPGRLSPAVLAPLS
jgi:hypothetical protein